MTTEQERYEQVDMPFYQREVAPILPPVVLDFHAHAWTSDQWLTRAGPDQVHENGASVRPYSDDRYMSTLTEYTLGDLLADAKRIFPGRDYRAVVFGQPTPYVDTELTNAYVLRHVVELPLYPLVVAGRGVSAGLSKERIVESGCFGIKAFLNWTGDDYGNVTIEDMLGLREMTLADELRLVVLLHVPRARRLADPEDKRGLREYALRYPGAQIVLAHCGRCYVPDQMWDAISAIKDLQNVYLDTSMVMDPLVLRMVFENLDSSRVLFGTDFPVAAMRGRRVYVMDHWVDVVLEGYAPSAFRVASDSIRASFMAYEIVLAVKMGAQTAGLTAGQLQSVFCDNGMAVLSRVMEGRQLAAAKWRAEQRVLEHTIMGGVSRNRKGCADRSARWEA